MDFLIDQERPLRILAGILARGDIPHAFLLTGVDGVGKRTAAMRFAMACGCSTLGLFTAAGEISDSFRTAEEIIPCGQCRSCRQILAGNHPDVIYIEPDRDLIKIDTIRDLLLRIVFKPHQAGRRVIIISDARAMNREAANALLKALEEPPPQTIFFLTAGQMADLLPTVVSRCQNIRFNPVSEAGLEKILRERSGLEPAAATSIALLADGSVARALAMAGEGGSDAASGMTTRRRWVLDELRKLPERKLPLVFAFAEKLAADKANLLQLLEIIKSYLRDILIYKYSPDHIVNTDMADQIRSAAAVDGAAALIAKMDAVTAVEKALARNVNPRLWLESLALSLAGSASRNEK